MRRGLLHSHPVGLVKADSAIASLTKHEQKKSCKGAELFCRDKNLLEGGQAASTLLTGMASGNP